MGEYADAFVDSMMEYDYQYDMRDPYDTDFEYCGSFIHRKRKIPTCNRCGQTNLIWKKLDGGWRLHEFLDNTIYEESIPILHTCKMKNKFNVFKNR